MNMNLKGQFIVRGIRDGNIFFEDTIDNAIVTVGKNLMLDTMFNAGSQATWYCGLIETISSLNNADTMASHSGWSEYTAVDEATRQAWNPDAASDRVLINPSTAYIEYTIDDTEGVTLDGMFLCNENTLGGSSGTLWSTGAFSVAPAFSDGDTVQVQYQLTFE